MSTYWLGLNVVVFSQEVMKDAIAKHGVYSLFLLILVVKKNKIIVTYENTNLYYLLN